MSDESFPNAEKLFREAYARKDPYPELLRLIKAHPSYEAVEELLVYYTEAAEADPSRAGALAAALVRVRDASDAPGTDTLGPDGIAGVFSRKLAELHNQGLYFEENNGALEPTNSFLINSYLSGLSFKYGLTESSDMYGPIQDALDTKDSDGHAQALLIGALIQLLVFGSHIAPSGTSYWSGAPEIATKLTAQKKRGLIKDKHFGEILDLVISNAEKGFRAEDNVADAWGKVFPSA